MHDTYPGTQQLDPTLGGQPGALPVVNPEEWLRFDGSLQNLEIASRGRVGGEVDLPLAAISPIQSKDEGFKVGDLPADLIAVIGAGKNNIGVIDTKPELGTESEYNYDDQRFMFANVEITAGNQDGFTFSVAKKPDGSPAAAFMKEPDTASRFGRDNKRRTTVFDAAGLNFDKDAMLSRYHGRIYFTDEGALHVADERSLTGTSIMLRPSVSPEVANREADTVKTRFLGKIGASGIVESVPTDQQSHDKSLGYEMPKRFKPDLVAAREVTDDEITRDRNNGGKPIDAEYRHNQIEARSTLVDGFLFRMYNSKEAFVSTLKRAHTKAAANDVYKKVGDGKQGLESHEHGEFRAGGELINHRSIHAKQVAQIAKRYNDPYGRRFDASDVATYSRVELEGIADDDKPRDVVYGQETPETFGYEFTYPNSDAIDSYMGKMQELGASFAQEIDKRAPNIDRALELIARQYQYGAAIRPFRQINNSLFMNLANMQIKLLGLPGITHQDMDHVAQRMQPDNFVAYFKNRVNGSEK